MNLFETVPVHNYETAHELSEGTYRLHTALTTLINRLDSPAISGTGVIRWGCPVPSFGDLSASRVATVGLNPSNREFVDEKGDELQGVSRRFHTLQSLGLSSWSDVDARHMLLILQSCCDYFQSNPYDRWFKRLDQVIAGAKTSYYEPSSTACHVDLIPYATSTKWAELSPRQRAALLDLAGDTLGLLLRGSSVRVIVLNGSSVVEHFKVIAGVRLERLRMSEWSLPRSSGRDVAGFSYKGVVDTISGISLGYSLLVLGFNHNIQSSYGVTRDVVRVIRDWVGRAASEAIE